MALYARSMSNVLAELGHEVTVLTNLHDTELKAWEFDGGVKVVRAKIAFMVSKSPVSGELLKILRQKILLSDLVVINLPSLEGVWATILARVYRKRILVVHHCDPVVTGIFGFAITWVAIWINFFVCLLADRIVTYTLDYAYNSPSLKWFKQKTIAILPPIKVGRIDKKVVETIKKKIGKTNIVFGFAGRFSADKGIRFLLETIPIIERSISNFKVAVAGPTNPIGETYFDELLFLRNKYSKRLVFLNTLEPAEMVNFYRCLNCLVLPSINRTESFGMVQAEALLCEVPVVASDLPGVRYCVKETGGGLIVPSGKINLLAKAMILVAANRQNFRPTNLQIFSIKNFVTSMSDLVNLATRSKI